MIRSENNQLPLPKQKWLAVVLCVWMTLAMLLGYIIFDGPIFTCLKKIGCYDNFREKICWVLGKDSEQALQNSEAGE